jgi:hypothetical protein
MSKLLENTYRHVNIALVNEIAVFSHDLGIDVWESLRAASTPTICRTVFARLAISSSSSSWLKTSAIACRRMSSLGCRGS